MQNFRPGVVERLGIGYDDVRAVNPDVVYASLSGFGPTGPYADKGAYDTVIQAYGGFAGEPGATPDGEPRFLKQTAADKVTALYASQAITAALFARERGAAVSTCELAMLDAVVSFLWADAAGNEVLLDADGSHALELRVDVPARSASPTAGASPRRPPTRTSSGMCRAFGVDGYDDPRLQTIADAQPEPRVRGRDHGRGATRSASTADDRRRDRPRSRPRPCRAASCSRRPSSPTTRTRRGRAVRGPRAPRSRAASASPDTRRSSRRTPAAPRRSGAAARRAHRRGPRRARLRPGRVAELRASGAIG